MTATLNVCDAFDAIAVAAGAKVNGPTPVPDPPAGGTPLDALAVQLAPVTCKFGSNDGVSVKAP